MLPALQQQIYLNLQAIQPCLSVAFQMVRAEQEQDATDEVEDKEDHMDLMDQDLDFEPMDHNQE